MSARAKKNPWAESSLPNQFRDVSRPRFNAAAALAAMDDNEIEASVSADAGETLGPAKLSDAIGEVQPLVAAPSANGAKDAKAATKRTIHALGDTIELAKSLSAAQMFAIVLLVQQIPDVDVAEIVGIGHDTLIGWMSDPAFAAQTRRAVLAVRERVERGDFGVVAMAKAHAETMMKVLVTKANTAKDETARRAAGDVLALAGHVPIKKVESVNIHKMIDEMTPVELRAFVDHGVVPTRYRDKISAFGSGGAIDVTPKG